MRGAVIIIDYQVGNLGSVLNMFKKVGVPAMISSDPKVIGEAERILLPGIGRFDFCMQSLKKSGLIPLLEKKVFTDKVPTLGICVGYQLLAQHGEEGNCDGLGWIPAQVKKFKFLPSEKMKVPHMGWNWVKPVKESPLSKGFTENSKFYFAHSYYVETQDPNIDLLKTDYGFEFTSAIQKDNLFGVQFHPEKSHKYGMQLFKNFSEVKTVEAGL
jgi:glutamine amidotransferase